MLVNRWRVVVMTGVEEATLIMEEAASGDGGKFLGVWGFDKFSVFLVGFIKHSVSCVCSI